MPLPIVKHCLICEDIRLEVRNLVSFMGVYGFTPHVGIEIGNLELPVWFSLVFVGEPVSGSLKIGLRFQAPDGTPVKMETIPSENEQTFSPDAGPSIFAFRINATFPRPDTYTLLVSAEGHDFFKDTFAISQARPSKN
jgi:hypothetical protein